MIASRNDCTSALHLLRETLPVHSSADVPVQHCLQFNRSNGSAKMNYPPAMRRLKNVRTRKPRSFGESFNERCCDRFARIADARFLRWPRCKYTKHRITTRWYQWPVIAHDRDASLLAKISRRILHLSMQIGHVRKTCYIFVITLRLLVLQRITIWATIKFVDNRTRNKSPNSCNGGI